MGAVADQPKSGGFFLVGGGAGQAQPRSQALHVRGKLKARGPHHPIDVLGGAGPRVAAPMGLDPPNEFLSAPPRFLKTALVSIGGHPAPHGP